MTGRGTLGGAGRAVATPPAMARAHPPQAARTGKPPKPSRGHWSQPTAPAGSSPPHCLRPCRQLLHWHSCWKLAATGGASSSSSPSWMSSFESAAEGADVAGAAERPNAGCSGGGDMGSRSPPERASEVACGVPPVYEYFFG